MQGEYCEPQSTICITAGHKLSSAAKQLITWCCGIHMAHVRSMHVSCDQEPLRTSEIADVGMWVCVYACTRYLPHWYHIRVSIGEIATQSLTREHLSHSAILNVSVIKRTAVDLTYAIPRCHWFKDSRPQTQLKKRRLNKHKPISTP